MLISKIEDIYDVDMLYQNSLIIICMAHSPVVMSFLYKGMVIVYFVPWNNEDRLSEIRLSTVRIIINECGNIIKILL